MVPEAAGKVQILHEDPDVVVVDKPPAMLTHVHSYDRRSPNLRAVLEEKLDRKVFTVHRLDRGTSGVMVLALNVESANHLSLQFRDRSVKKTYRAIVRGHTPPDGTVEIPLDTDNGERVEAKTSFHTIATGTVHEPIGRYEEGWFSLVEIELHTGRRHQVRRHMHSINHPVIGDNRHGDKNYNRWVADRLGVRMLYLRATELMFTHPVTGAEMKFRVDFPPRWVAALHGLGLSGMDPKVDDRYNSFTRTSNE